MSNVNSLESEFTHWTMACYETQTTREKKETHWCGDGNSRGWDEPTQCGPSPKATCYQAERRGSFNLHLNTFHSSRSFALISPIIFGNGQMSSWHNVGAHHHREKPTPDANLGLLDLFSVLARSDNSGSLQSRGLFNWICLRWQNCFALIWEVFPPFSPPRAPSLRETGRLFGCHGKTGAEWFSVASDFHYLFSIRATYLSKKKQHVERESDRAKYSLANRTIVR